MAKSVSGTVTRYLVDDLNPTGYPQVVEELNGTGVVQRQYSYGLQRISENQVISSTWTPSFYGYDRGPHEQVFVRGVEDGMGNVRTLTSSTGAVTDTYDYDAFGNKINSTGTTSNSYLYRGEFFDSDLGLYYLRDRYMNPLTGRFMSRDPNDPQLLDSDRVPADPKKLHKYLYADGDPVNMLDPTGHEAAEEEAGADFQSIFQTVRYADALHAKDILAIECASLGLQAIFDKMFHQTFTEPVPWPLDAACLLLTF